MGISKTLSFLILLVLANATRGSTENRGQDPLSVGACNHPPYTIHLFSKAPLVIYIEDFLTPEERSHLQEITYAQSQGFESFLYNSLLSV
jgi:prolyl 4-hydroxylase